jgi:hypothetical protein
MVQVLVRAEHAADEGLSTQTFVVEVAPDASLDDLTVYTIRKHGSFDLIVGVGRRSDG